MSKENKTVNDHEILKKSEVPISKKETKLSIKPLKKQAAITQVQPQDLWQAFDDTFARFRTDFEDLLFPANWPEAFSFVPEIRVPIVDLKDGEKEYSLKAEMPGFKKQDIEIEVQDDAIAITGTAGWKYDEKGQLYICKERACKTFYRRFELPEKIKVEEVNANLSDGVLEITLPKKIIKEKRKVTVK
jgi:HSP20 family protein